MGTPAFYSSSQQPSSNPPRWSSTWASPITQGATGAYSKPQIKAEYVRPDKRARAPRWVGGLSWKERLKDSTDLHDPSPLNAPSTHPRSSPDSSPESVPTPLPLPEGAKPHEEEVKEALRLHRYGCNRLAAMDLEQAEQLLKAALEMKVRLLHPLDPSIGMSLQELGYLQLQMGNFPEAEATLLHALLIRAEDIANAELAGQTRELLGRLYETLGRAGDAQSIRLFGARGGFVCGAWPYCESEKRSFDLATINKCSNCGAAYYCSESCQAREWVRHRLFCEPLRAEILAARLQEDVPPQSDVSLPPLPAAGKEPSLSVPITPTRAPPKPAVLPPPLPKPVERAFVPRSCPTPLNGAESPSVSRSTPQAALLPPFTLSSSDSTPSRRLAHPPPTSSVAQFGSSGGWALDRAGG